MPTVIDRSDRSDRSPRTSSPADTSFDASALEDFDGTLDRRSDDQPTDRRRRPFRQSPIVLAPEFDENDRSDRLAPYQNLIVVSRWCALLVSAVALGTLSSDRSLGNTLVFAGFGLLTTYRTMRPIRHFGFEIGLAASIVSELAIAVAGICATGYWRSPLSFLLIPPVMVGAFSQDGPLVIGYGLLSSLCVSILELSQYAENTPERWRDSWQWTIQIVAFTIVAGVGRRIVHESLVRHTKALDNMNRLTSANGLLFALHKVAQTLPASLDLEDVLRSTITNARNLFPSESITVMIRDGATNSWEVARNEGARLSKVYENTTLPAAIAIASRSMSPITLRELPPGERHGLLSGAKSGIYAPLRSRQVVFGVLAIEHSEPGFDEDSQVDLLKRFAEPASIAIDNARWFGRIRRVAADEERVRIARDLHDRIGQSLAYLGFELDRLGRHPEASPVSDEIKRLRSDVGKVVGEVRETLYDIRTDVDADRKLPATLGGFLERVQRRNPNLDITFDHDVTGSLPIRREREMWLIAQEAIVNAERHAKATALAVRWTTNGRSATLVVSDNGRGFAPGAGRNDSYGIRGLHERAAGIGARVEILSTADKGTTITCRLD